jgi:hypothetical protein
MVRGIGTIIRSRVIRRLLGYKFGYRGALRGRLRKKCPVGSYRFIANSQLVGELPDAFLGVPGEAHNPAALADAHRRL